MSRCIHSLAVALCLFPILASAQYISPQADPGFFLLTMPEDPHTYAAGAGPAGGFGIAAAADNPAALAWGYPVQGRYLNPDAYRNFSIAARLSEAWSVGASGTWLTYRQATFNYASDYEPARGYEYAVRFTAARRSDSTFSYGAALTYLRTSFRRTLTVIDSGVGLQQFPVQPRAELYTASLGVRLHGPFVLDPPKLERKGRSVLLGNYHRPRWSLGLAALDLPLASSRDRTYWNDSDPPTRAAVGGSFRPYYGSWLGVALNASYTYWVNHRRAAPLTFVDPTVSLGTWRVGFGLDVAGIVETGLAVGGGYEETDHRTCTYVIIGPPFLRLTLQGETRELVHYGGFGGYGGYRTERIDQIAVTFSWPFRYYRHEAPQSEPSIY